MLRFRLILTLVGLSLCLSLSLSCFGYLIRSFSLVVVVCTNRLAEPKVIDDEEASVAMIEKRAS